MKTKAELISDLELRLSQHKLDEDYPISREYLGHILDITGERLLATFVDTELKKDRGVPPFCIRPYEATAFYEDLQPFRPGLDYFRLALPVHPLNVSGDRSIVACYNPDGLHANIVTYQEFITLSNMRYTKFSPEHVVAFRKGQELLIFGPENTAATVDFELLIVPSIVGLDVQEADVYPMSEELLRELLDASEEQIRKGLIATPPKEPEKEI